MNQLKFFSSLSLIIYLLIFSACSKEMVDPNGKIVSKSNFNRSYLIDPSNGNNIYDFIGEAHNEGLDYLILEHGDDLLNASPSNRRGLMAQYSAEFISIYYPNWIDNSSYDLESDIFQSQSTPYSDSLLLNSGFNYTQVGYANQILGLIEEFADSNIETLLTEIIKLETEINEDQSLTENQKSYLLSGASVARYSCVYWHEESLNTNSPWGSFGDPALITPGGFGAADTRGAFGGACTAFGYGLVNPITWKVAAGMVAGGALMGSGLYVYDNW